MNKYVLEILDGSQKGSIFALGEDRVTLGRRSENSIPIKDEKCSGEHAEITFEGGNYVLRDLGSRNGTSLDGRRIEEVVLSPFDVFHVGRVQIVFRDEQQSMATDDLSMSTIDSSQMARRGGRRGAPVGAIVVVLLLVLGGGAWAWLEFFSGGGGRRAANTPTKPVVVPQNMIAVGVDNFEADGGWVLSGLESAGFQIVVSRALANSGDTSIEAVYRKDEDGATYGLALARLSEPVQVTAGSKLRLGGFVSTEGKARVALRVAFQSTVDGSTLITGSPLASSDGYEEVEAHVVVPRGMDRAEFQVLAVLPDEDSIARVDDVALVLDRDAAVDPIDLTTDNGRALSGSGASFRITTGELVVVHGVRPVVRDPLLLELDRLGELATSDAGFTLAAQEHDSAGFKISFSGGDAAAGLALDFPSGSANVVARSGADAPFAVREPQFSAKVSDVLLGAEETRCLVSFAEPASVRGKHGRDIYTLEIEGVREFDLDVRFEQAGKTARELNRDAARARRAGEYATALDSIQKVIEKFPHDDRLARDAQAIRVSLLAELEQRADELRREAAAAQFFDARNGYERVANGIDELLAKFGERHVPTLEAFKAASERMNTGIAAIEKAEGDEHRRTLDDLATALDDGGQTGLSSTIRDYIKKHYGGGGN